tara:strand:+ start:396 stop:524 length:129 start_codon:yes stop_codon:yes gene_type:complete
MKYLILAVPAPLEKVKLGFIQEESDGCKSIGTVVLQYEPVQE